MNAKSRDWMWMVSGFSLLLLVGCTTDSTTSSLKKTDPPSLSMTPPADQKMSYSPEPEEKEPSVSKTAKKPVAMTIASVGSFAASEHLKPVYFDLHQSKLSADALAVIQENAAWIKSQPPFLLEVVGVSDQRGSTAKNKILAEHRAVNVKLAYIAQGIMPERIQVISMGEETDRCTDLTEDCFKLSRRADTKIEEKALLAQR